MQIPFFSLVGQYWYFIDLINIPHLELGVDLTLRTAKQRNEAFTVPN